MALSSVAYLAQSADRPYSKKLCPYLSVAVTSIAFLSYFAMSLGIGITEVDGRPFYQARYWDWALTTPLLLIDLGCFAKAPTSEIFYAVSFDILMVLAGLIGCMVGGLAKWYFFGLGMLFFIPVIQVLFTSFKESSELSDDSKKKYMQLAVMIAALWSFYPLVWIAAEGTQLISPFIEITLYAVLDVCAKCVFGFVLINDESLKKPQ